MSIIRTLDDLPEINLLDDEGITLDNIMNRMVADFESKYQEVTGREITLYPADDNRIKLNVVAGEIYQICQVIQKYFRQNFLQYMQGKYLVNWGATLGFSDSGIKAAVVTLRFSIPQSLNYVVAIPEGTRVTAGDNVFFATDEYVEIPIGETYVEVNATCTEFGNTGNGYAVGQITTVVDPVPYSPSVTNIVATDGGANAYSDDELKELLYLFPTTSSTAGPEDKYIILVKQYSSSIVDSKITTTDEAVVTVYIMLEDGELPSEEYCENVLNYIKDSKVTPDTDMVEVLAPEAVHYTINATYYISEDKKNVATTIQENVENAAQEFINFTHSNIGIDINPDMLTSYATVAGAKRIVITNPEYTVVTDSQVAICDSVNLIYGGVEGN